MSQLLSGDGCRLKLIVFNGNVKAIIVGRVPMFGASFSYITMAFGAS